MARKKLQHFAYLNQSPLYFDEKYKGEFGRLPLPEGRPVLVELACGKGAYSVALAEKFPEAQVLGVDKKGSRLWHGVQGAEARNLNNVFFVRGPIDWMGSRWRAGRVNEIWITFPDPHEGSAGEQKRLSSERFLYEYERWLALDGLLHFKTDHEGLFEFTLENLRRRNWSIQVELRDLYGGALETVSQDLQNLLRIQTDFEKKHLKAGRKIYYVQARVPAKVEERIVLGGGCFWCIEAGFRHKMPMVQVRSGYAGGARPNPSYEQVCTGVSGHAEVVELVWNPREVSLFAVLDLFFALHDPTQKDGQGADKGTQYRSCIFYTEFGQKCQVGAYLRALQKTLPELQTTLQPLEAFYPAEGHHQDYYRRNQDAPYCQFVIRPKLDALGG